MQRLPSTIKLIESGMGEGLHVGAQLYVQLHGDVVADRAFGLAAEGVEMRQDTLMPWLSSGKPLAAIALGQLWERGLLDVEDPVGRFIPEFSANGKQAVTVRHLLTHTAGLQGGSTGWPDASWGQIIATICALGLVDGWQLGQTAGYQPTATWFILGEIVQRLSGMSYQTYLDQHVFQPLGMADCHAAVDAEQYAAYGSRMGVMWNTAVRPARAVSTASPRHAAAASPGASLRGPIRELGKLYESLLNRDSRLLRSTTIAALTARHRTGWHDRVFKSVVDWGLGFILNSWFYGNENLPYSYGPHASRRTFGHSGAQSSVAFADPERKLVVAVVFNGMCGEVIHARRQTDLCAAIYEDLGLT